MGAGNLGQAHDLSLGRLEPATLLDHFIGKRGNVVKELHITRAKESLRRKVVLCTDA